MYTVKITDRTRSFDEPIRQSLTKAATTPQLEKLLVGDVHKNTADQEAKYTALAQIYQGCARERTFKVLTPERLYEVKREGDPTLRELLQADSSGGLLAEHLCGSRQEVPLAKPAALAMALWQYYSAQCMNNFPDYELEFQQHDFVSLARLAFAEGWTRMGFSKVVFLGYSDNDTKSNDRANDYIAYECWQSVVQTSGWYMEVFEGEFGRPALWRVSMHDEGFSMSMWFVAMGERDAEK